MKLRFFNVASCVCLLLTVWLCACSSSPTPTVITKAPGDVVLRTDATTTTTTTTTTTSSNGSTANEEANSASTTSATTASVVIGEEGSTEKGKDIAELAISLIGTPFQTGANGPDAFDNPSFVVYCYKQNGYTIPRKASAMASYGQDVAPDLMQVGDIVIFCNEIGGSPDFCGIYIGNDQFVSCNNPNSPTGVQNLNTPYWAQRFIGARRPIE